ncbi:cytochrome P450 [Bradyrhizobium sp.]|uniref:cytochrome P450 n=1 Tax=Bradyrhizobium sp. TaxID=376 RepID=UPI0025C061AE|nr:cytochrome P450 [Bradyrhizobium sp.]MBV8916943.1 cytochrome P450 [Bradyrhizobium sp.]
MQQATSSGVRDANSPGASRWSSENVLRPAPGGIKGWLMAFALSTGFPLLFRLLRWLPWNLRLGVVFATRYDEVCEIFRNDAAFRVAYGKKLHVITGGEPFFLSMDDTPQYRHDTEALRKAVRVSDIPARLIPEVERLGEQLVNDAIADGKGQIEVVELVRRITFELYQSYLGIPDPPGAALPASLMRLFEFQFADDFDDPELRKEVDVVGPALRSHIDTLIAARKTAGVVQDDVLGRCVAMQAADPASFSDAQIRTSLLGLIYGGPPQPPMVVPQALEQLLRRPDALKGAQEAARSADDKLLAGFVFEAMRFDPVAPFLRRVAKQDADIAAGTPRAVTIPRDKTVLVAASSAMMDERRVPNPTQFDPNRAGDQYIHFGLDHHQCFGIHMNNALLPLMLKALLKRQNLRRAPGARGKLSKRGPFADQLWVAYE